jgi:hypothetical protein
MDVDVKAVPLWLMIRGIGHVVASTREYFHFTACGTMTNNGDETKRMPRRKCRRCVERLKVVILKQD